MLILGYGKLGSAVTNVLYSHRKRPVDVYNRSEDALHGKASVNIVRGDHFKYERNFFVALPAHAYEPFFEQWCSSFPENSRFYYAATKVRHEEISALLRRDQEAIACKLLGHAHVLKEQKKGVFVLPSEFYKKQFDELTEGALSTIVGAEEHVETANTIATEESLRALYNMEERLMAHNIDRQMIRVVQNYIPPGIVHAHLTNTHGGFAKTIINRWENEENNGE